MQNSQPVGQTVCAGGSTLAQCMPACVSLSLSCYSAQGANLH